MKTTIIKIILIKNKPSQLFCARFDDFQPVIIITILKNCANQAAFRVFIDHARNLHCEM